MPIVTINYDKCKGIDCAECVDVCPMEVLVLEGDKVEIVDPEDCSFCEVCMDVLFSCKLRLLRHSLHF